MPRCFDEGTSKQLIDEDVWEELTCPEFIQIQPNQVP